MTPTKAKKLFDKVGGIDSVNKEAKTIFDQFGTKELRFLGRLELANFPAIAGLGNAISIYPDQPGFTGQLHIRYGSHWNTKLIFIYPQNRIPGTNETLNFIQVTTNIFVTK